MTPDQARPHLTEREYDAWILWHRGMSQHNIAIALGKGRRTVRDTLHEAHAKLFSARKENEWATVGERKPTSSTTTKQTSSPTSSENSPTTTHAPSKTHAPTEAPTAATARNSEASPPSDATWLDTFPAPDPTN